MQFLYLVTNKPILKEDHSRIYNENMGDIEKKTQSEGIIPIASQKEIRKSIEENLEPPDGGCQVKKKLSMSS